MVIPLTIVANFTHLQCQTLSRYADKLMRVKVRTMVQAAFELKTESDVPTITKLKALLNPWGEVGGKSQSYAFTDTGPNNTDVRFLYIILTRI